MKFYFVSAVLVVVCLASAFVGYGLYLNTQRESYIATVESERVFTVIGSQVAFRDLRPEIHLQGISLHTEKMADVLTQVEGTLRNLVVAQGESVQKDQKLCELENPMIQLGIIRAQAALDKAEASYLHSKTTLDRYEYLRKEKAVSESELETIQAQTKAAESEVNASRAALGEAEQKQTYQTVVAPMDGDVLIIYHKQGSHLTYGVPVMLIGDFTTLIFNGLLRDKDIQNISPLRPGYELALDLTDEARGFKTNFAAGYDETTVFTARLIGISPPPGQPATHRHVIWAIDNKGKILEPGLYSNATIRTVDPVHVLAVPVETIRNSPDPVVYVKNPDDTLGIRKVRTGVTDNRYIEIVEGLSEGDVIIESDVRDLKAGTAIAVVLAQHAPKDACRGDDATGDHP